MKSSRARGRSGGGGGDGFGEMAQGLVGHIKAVAGLVIGGLIAAPIAGYATKLIPARTLMGIVGVLVIALASYQAWQVFQRLAAG